MAEFLLPKEVGDPNFGRGGSIMIGLPAFVRQHFFGHKLVIKMKNKEISEKQTWLFCAKHRTVERHHNESTCLDLIKLVGFLKTFLSGLKMGEIQELLKMFRPNPNFFFI